MKKNETNKRIYTIDNIVIKQWEKDVGMKFKDIITHIIDLGNSKKRIKFYEETIPLRHKYQKPLSGCKIDKSKFCIQKQGYGYNLLSTIFPALFVIVWAKGANF